LEILFITLLLFIICGFPYLKKIKVPMFVSLQPPNPPPSRPKKELFLNLHFEAATERISSKSSKRFLGRRQKKRF